ncbi:cadherin domain-containing protein [Thiothrix subterranea]|uniref:Cadherin domain-containing protein n=1 Tax=Thiothrix subterranea TaxID=2735563 RepID=A0AA51MRQ9_9GAMM|nr:cadherin domain-containing protein [Thiothrix subterranea]MDQ5767017.1 cadherin domain-containing protein [Thiothrix subterranea]WML88121.1 cadherin domain-containing protein [Thiothrix subterranea]
MNTMKYNRLTSLGILLMLFYGTLTQAAPAYNPNATPTDMTSLLDGPGLSVNNLSIPRGVLQQYGVFSNGGDVWGVKSGVFLNTGNLGSIQAPNNGAAYSHNTKVQYLDLDLGKISANAKYDPAIIEFDITPQGDRLNFVFAFGSEEYPEYVCSSFNDAFGLFVSGPGLTGTKNAAFLPDTGEAIAVNNVNAGKPGANQNGAACNLNNVTYFVDNGNGSGSTSTQLDGYTRPITASLDGLTPGQSYHVKLALADAGDPAYDSGAFFKWLTSTKSTPVDLSLQAAVNTPNPAWNSEVELSYTLKNAMAIATSLVQVELEWPVGFTWVSDDSGGRYNPNTGVWDADVIPASGSKILKIRARVGTASNYRVDGEITFAFNEDPDSTPFNRTSKSGEDDTASITVYPVDKPANQPPVISSDGGNASAVLSVSEGQTAVTTVKATDPDGSALSYSLSGVDAVRFALNTVTGALSFIAPPDYEYPIDADKNNKYDLVVTVSDGSLTDTQALTVQVLDASENAAPQITSNGGGTSATLSLDENVTAVTKVTATDSDGDYVTFDITGGADAALFKITTSTGRLSFISAPDYEKPQDANRDNIYEVDVRGSDGVLNDTQLIRVQILNVQEGKPPVITSNGGNATANINVPENQQAVTTVTATDADGDTVTYRLSTGADDGLFQINTNSGKLAFIKAPDYENPKDANQDNIYILTVIATDGVFETTQLLFVTVTKVVENAAPQITSNGGGNTASVSLEENLTAVTTVTATDPNGDPLTLSIKAGADANLFKITASTGKLSFLNAPDYEKPQDINHDNYYEVEVTVSDGVLKDTQLIRVQILNVQEGKPPVITSNGGNATANINVPENQQAVTTVTATDADGDTVTYRLSTGADDGLFQINTNSGQLAFIKAPDYETPKDANQDNIYILTVIATDGVFETTQLLFVTVTDGVENAAPKIISDGGGVSATLSMEENQKIATIVTATDADGDAITYSISGGADAALFQISSGGTLSFAVAPDYEKPQDSNKDNIYVVTVIASDGTQQVTQTLNLVVTDVLENLPPVMTSYKGAATVTLDVEENKTLVMVATANDPNGEALTYSISGGADAALFKINAATGLLEFIAAPDYELPKDADKNNTYAVVVSATDAGGLSATQSITAKVTNIDDVPFVNVSLRAWLQGAYKSTDKMMRGDLHRLGLMPQLQPYGELKTAFGYATSSDMVSPFDYKGTETASAAVLAATGGDAPVDWVLVELRNVFDPGKRVAVAAGLLQRDGDIVDAATGSKVLPITNADDGLYYIAIRHRNHLAVMTKEPVSVSRGIPAAVDFTALTTKVYDSVGARLESSGVALMWAGDANNSNTIIANGPGSDNSVLLGAILVAPENTNVNAAFRLPGYYSTDFNLDGTTLYTGPNNDINLMLGNILMHPGNASFSGNYIIRGEAPL